MPEATAIQRKTTVDEAFALAPHHLKRLLGNQEVADRFLVVALNQVRKVPALAKCSKESILDGLVRMARLNLDPAIPNDAFLVPYNGEATLIVGYGGLRKLVLRNADVLDVFAQVVCQNDHYRPAESPITLPTHRLPEAFQPRGRAIGYYAAALLKSGLWRVVAMSKAEVAGHRDRYSAGAKSTFWADNHPDKEGFSNFDKMAMKTCLRQLCSPRYLSLDADVSQALQSEEALYQPLPGHLMPGRPAPVPSLHVPIEVLVSEVSGDHAETMTALDAARSGKPRKATQQTQEGKNATQATKDTPEKTEGATADPRAPAPQVDPETGELFDADVSADLDWQHAQE
jgi:phage RecT family recombinase